MGPKMALFVVMALLISRDKAGRIVPITLISSGFMNALLLALLLVCGSDWQTQSNRK
jgi:hypothetical protein